MKRGILVLIAGFLSLAFVSDANAFGHLFGRKGGCCGAAPSCCEAEPTCCDAAPSCCDAQPTCCEAAPVCEPSCGCDAEPSCCEAAPCCGKRHRFGHKIHAMKAWFKSRKRSCCDAAPSCCDAPVVESSCGCGH